MGVRVGAAVMIAPSTLPSDPHELERLRHENARLRRSLSLRGRLEEVVADNARLRRALNTYGRHTHPRCHDIVKLGADERYGCLCGLDQERKENPGG